MKKTDLILVVLVLIAAAGIYLFYSAGAEKGLTAVVTVDGVQKAEFPLDENTAVGTGIHTEWGYNFVHAEHGQVWITEADCRDQICVEHKKISRVGETIVCLPHKLVVEIIGEGDEAFDTVVG